MKGRLPKILIVSVTMLLYAGPPYAGEKQTGGMAVDAGQVSQGSSLAGFLEWIERHTTPHPTVDRKHEHKNGSTPSDGPDGDETWYGIGYENRVKMDSGNASDDVEPSGKPGIRGLFGIGPTPGGSPSGDSGTEPGLGSGSGLSGGSGSGSGPGSGPGGGGGSGGSNR